jgi:hypothetical protein
LISERRTWCDARGWPVLVALSFTCLPLASCGSGTAYYQDGALRSEGRLAFRVERPLSSSEGREDGTWTYWYPNGERRESGAYVDGRRAGEWTQWYPNGQRRSRGERAWDAASSASPRTGLWTYWHENGEVLARGLYVKGLREGHWDYSREDGSIDAEMTGEYHLDQRLD